MCILYWNSLIYSGNAQLGHNSSICLGHSLSLSRHKSRQNTSTMQYIVLLKDSYLTIINQPNILLQTYKKPSKHNLQKAMTGVEYCFVPKANLSTPQRIL